MSSVYACYILVGALRASCGSTVSAETELAQGLLDLVCECRAGLVSTNERVEIVHLADALRLARRFDHATAVACDLDWDVATPEVQGSLGSRVCDLEWVPVVDGDDLFLVVGESVDHVGLGRADC